MVINRTLAPNKFIQDAYGTIHAVKDEASLGANASRYEFQYYIQTSQNEEIPQWIPLGDFLVKVFESEIANQEFMESCLSKFK